MFLDLFFSNLYVFALATAVAVLEIQIEGKNGWAEKLPAWRPAHRSRLRRLYALFSNKKELDGYHVSLFFVLILTFHMPFLFGAPISLDLWLKNLSLFFLFMVIWDYLWFVWNPWFTVRKFHPKKIDWHKKWFLFMPLDYWEGILISAAVLLFGSSLIGGMLYWWLAHIFLLAAWTVISVLISLWVFKKEDR